MKKYAAEKIKNIGIVSHARAGKTSLTESLLFSAGHLTRLGRVDDGTTTTDYLPAETARKVTISTALAPVEWKDYKFNFIDTPGYSDFAGEVNGALRVADNMLLVVCSVSGIEVRTEILWDYAEELQKPRIIFINKLDRENADFEQNIADLQTQFGNKVVPLWIPIGKEDNFSGVVDIIKNKAYDFTNGLKEIPVPENMKDQIEVHKAQAMESIAECNDELLMKYLEGEELTQDELMEGLKKGIKEACLFPVFCGSAYKNYGPELFLNYIAEIIPGAADFPPETDKDSALVFKSIADPFVGKMNFIKVMAGSLKAGQNIYNSTKEKEEKVSHFMVMRGKTSENIDEVYAGDIAAVSKLQFTGTGDTLCYKNNAVVLEGINFPEPVLQYAVLSKNRGDEDKIASAINKILEEDLSLRYKKDPDTKESIIIGMGDLHLDIIKERLKNTYNLEVELKTPKVPYKETIRNNVKAQGKHKKQSGGAGQYGDVWLTIEPNYEEKFTFTENVFGGAVPKNYFPAVEKGVQEAMHQGILAGYPVINIKATLVDGSYHPVDSNEMSFKMAGILAFRNAMAKANAVILEPVMDVAVTVPEVYMGDIMGDMNGRRGRIIGMEALGKNQVIKARVPLAEMYSYAINLKAMTQGRGNFTMEFAEYEEVPPRLSDEIIKESKKEEEN
ncbi:MAG: elongation factor G [Eubacteriales bacterium]|nr:elongation factor G [Eubacteriales bacterium]